MNKVLLTTLFSGYNYGSSLQAYATKCIIDDLGYSCVLVGQKSLVKGRNIQLRKLITILYRTILTMNLNTLKAYRNSYKKSLIGDSSTRFEKFEKEYLQPIRMSWNTLKKEADDAIASVVGSDQLWNPLSLYVDPMYYLRFAPANKRISFSTSMGHDSIAKYNEKKLRKWISEIKCLSVREDSGVMLIKKLCGRDAFHLLDPSLLLDGDTWRSKFNTQKCKKNYILAYFLDKPTEKAKICIRLLKDKHQCDVIAIPYIHKDMSYADKIIPTGPLDFLSLVDNAIIVVTDSFHGTAFSINLHTPFFVFDRNYATVHTQSSRVVSLLKKLKLQNRYEPTFDMMTDLQVDFFHSDQILNTERIVAKMYLKEGIESCN